ncbi:MAG TPA: uroporphyrinogen decarboxylase family protein, partial [Spirochaetia bacterium]|nr:uroporphyrinogen decarboxylase family protein [Spirochaetia bacterium]
CEALAPHLLHSALAGADPSGQVPVTLWMHRGCVPFVSPRDFRDIYWATLRPILQEIWAQGHQVLLYAEGTWAAHLESFAELPDHSVIFHVDRTDLERVRRVLGGRFCLSGGIPNDLLTTGTPAQVRARCRQVIETLGADGGYILDASALIMDDARVENVEAVVEAALEFGVYSRAASPAAWPPGPPPTPSQPTVARTRMPPGVCVPWEEKRLEFPEITGDESVARRAWEAVDGMGYGFLWTNLTW